MRNTFLPVSVISLACSFSAQITGSVNKRISEFSLHQKDQYFAHKYTFHNKTIKSQVPETERGREEVYGPSICKITVPEIVCIPVYFNLLLSFISYFSFDHYISKSTG